jgi:hypothetical protein
MTDAAPELKSRLGRFAGEEVGTSMFSIDLYSDEDAAERGADHADQEIDGARLGDTYHVIGVDINFCPILIKRDWTGPVMLFDADEGESQPIAESLTGFLAILRTFAKVSDDLDMGNAEQVAYFETLAKFMAFVAKQNGGEIPEFWARGFLPP